MTDQDGGVAVDPAAIQQLLEMTGGDPEFLDELIQSFLDGAKAQLADMERAVAAGAAEDIVRPAHSLKGNSSNIGAHRLVELARELEALGHSGALGEAGALVTAAAIEFEAVKAELAAIRERP
jgi:HPt (histidine-containing phosphotransfer) domain-containing protein